jgi:hypothetical protein
VVNPRSQLWSNPGGAATGILKDFAYHDPHNNKRRGGVVDTQDNPIPVPQAIVAPQAAPAPQGFTLEDILWAIGIWSVTISLSPVIVFYLLMVA